MRIAVVIVASVASLLCGSLAWGATLEKLTVDQMSQKSTLIVRARIGGCTGEQRGSVIYTRCKIGVTERWKGTAGNHVDVLIPGGTAGGFTQVFTGTPKFNTGSEHVLFLWSGPSGNLQVIGLSQGVFDVKFNGKGAWTAKREAASEVMLDAGGRPVQDEGIEMTVTALRNRVDRALQDTSK